MDDEFDNFLHKVDEINSILQGLKSKDSKISELATKRADIMLQNSEEKVFHEDGIRIKTNKSIINKKAFESDNKQGDSMSPEAFMAHVEKDAAQRAADRKERKEIADTYKRKGNDAFRKKEYEKALDFYTKAIEKIKDNTLLYVNRALTAINLGLYSRAISDCEWAHKLSENNLKAWLYKAKAHYQLGDYEKAMECLREAEKRNPDPESKTLITEYTISWNFNEDKEGSD